MAALPPFEAPVAGIVWVALRALLADAPHATWGDVARAVATAIPPAMTPTFAPTQPHHARHALRHLQDGVAAMTAHWGTDTRVAACLPLLPPAPVPETWEATNTASTSAPRWAWLAPAARRGHQGLPVSSPAERQSRLLRLRPAAGAPTPEGALDTAPTFIGFHLGDSADLRRQPAMFPLQDAWRLVHAIAPRAGWGWQAGRLEALNQDAAHTAGLPSRLTPVLSSEGWLYAVPVDPTRWEVVDLDHLRRLEAMRIAFADAPALDDDC